MANSWTDNPFSNFFDQIGTGFNQAFGGGTNQNQPAQSKYDLLANSLNIGLSEGDEGYLDLEDFYTRLYKEQRPADWAKLMVADIDYNTQTEKEKGFAAIMNNPAFIMGMGLMQGAGEGKNIGEAMLPAAQATQAFMTNQELRRQNKKLLRNQSGSLVEAAAASVEHQTGQQIAGKTLLQMDITTEHMDIETQKMMKELSIKGHEEIMMGVKASMFADNEGFKKELLRESVIAQRINNEQEQVILDSLSDIKQIEYDHLVHGLEFSKVKMNQFIKMGVIDEKSGEINVKQMEQGLLQGDINLQRDQKELELYLKNADKHEALKLLSKDLGNQAIQEELRGAIIMHNMQDYKAKSFVQKKEDFLETIKGWRNDGTIDANQAMQMREYDTYDDFMKQGGLPNIEDDPEKAELIRSEIADVMGETWKQWLPPIFGGMSNAESNQIQMDMNDMVYKTVLKISKDGKWDATLIDDAQKILEQDGFLEASEWYEKWLFQLDTYTYSSTNRAYGGPVQAGKPYTVGEQGPETFVPNQNGNIVSNPVTQGGYTWENAMIDNSPELQRIVQSSGIEAAKVALKKFRPDLYV